MRVFQQLTRRLTEVVDHVFQALALHRIADRVQIDRALVRAVEEHVERLLGSRPLLFGAEDEVDPLVQVRRHVLALQCAHVLVDEVFRRFGPVWQDDVVHALTSLTLKLAKVKFYKVTMQCTCTCKQIPDISDWA